MRSSIDLLGGLSDAHVQRAAMTIFLNRTCFNGLFRVNSNGDFNVPHGRYSRPDICNHSVLFAAHQALEGVEIRTGSYEVVDDLIGPRSLVYLDPPYRPLPGTTSFTDYIQKSTFGDSDQRKLAEHYRSWDARGASLILSNSDQKRPTRQTIFSTTSTKDFTSSVLRQSEPSILMEQGVGVSLNC